ncbi:MAG: T9SS type A sorting domain-containing protein [Bacteroidota bacterium]
MKKNLLAFSIVLLAAFANAQTPRLCLYEEFTGETCPPCASTNPGLNAILLSPTNATKIIAIKWQVPIPSAPSNTWSLYQTNKTEIDWRYRSIASGGYGYIPAVTYAPFGKIDGQSQAVFGATGTNPDHPANLSNAMISTAQSYTSAFSVTMNRAWDVSGAINLTVNIQATAPFTASGSLVFRTVMVERLIQFSVQSGTNGEKDFEDVAIKSYGTSQTTGLQTGVSMAPTWTVGQSQTFTLSCMPPTYVRKKSEIAFVGFIQDDGNQKVAQSVRADKQALPDDALAVAAYAPLTCASTIAPNVDVQNLGLNAITAMTITAYVDGVASPNKTFWTGTLAPTATLNVPLNSISVPAVSGAHTFSYNITAINNMDVDPTNNGAKTNFMVASSFIGVPVAEGFAGAAFPPTGFASINANNGPAWSRVVNTGAYQMAPLHSAKYDFFTNPVLGDQDAFYLPPMNLTGGNVPTLGFDWSYAQRSNSSDDQLDIFLSDNCGTSWTNVYSNHGSALATSAPINNAYTPVDISEWQSWSINLNSWNKPNVLCKFVTTNNKGNNLYLDNINLSQDLTGISKNAAKGFNVMVYPNPANEKANIQITSEKAGTAKVVVINTIGQVVFEKQVNVYAGTNTAYIDLSNFAAGVYNVSVDTENNHVVSKLTVTK